MKKYLYFLMVLFLVSILACEEESGPIETGTDPEIEEIKMRDKWNSASIMLSKVEVIVTDPQGFSNIDGVFLEVKNSSGQVIFSDSLYDDGAYTNSQDGDVIAGDGIYSNQFSSVQVLSGAADGNYDFSFTAIDKDNHESAAIEKAAIFGQNSRPEIVAVSAPDTLYNASSAQVLEMAFSDNDGIDDVIRGYMEVENDSGNVVDNIEFFNDGDFALHGDLFANDSVFALKLDSTFAAAKQGNHTLHYYVEDSFNEFNSISVFTNIHIENFVGTIISTSVPDSLEKPTTPGSTVPFELNARVSDPQGLADISSVYFLSQKPDGTFSGNGFQFELFDDGDIQVNGDNVAGDGEFSLIIQITDSNDPGTYTFHFYMRDLVGNLTNVTLDSIVIY